MILLFKHAKETETSIGLALMSPFFALQSSLISLLDNDSSHRHYIRFFASETKTSICS